MTEKPGEPCSEATQTSKTPLESRVMWGGMILLVLACMGIGLSPEEEADLLDHLVHLREEVLAVVSFFLLVVGRTDARLPIRWPWTRKP